MPDDRNLKLGVGRHGDEENAAGHAAIVVEGFVPVVGEDWAEAEEEPEEGQ